MSNNLYGNILYDSNKHWYEVLSSSISVTLLLVADYIHTKLTNQHQDSELLIIVILRVCRDVSI